MEKQYVIDDINLKESWRLFHIMAEFVEGFENLNEISPAVTVFGSARSQKGDELYDKNVWTGRNYWERTALTS